MPYIPPEVLYVIGVYNRCRNNNCLPRAGGLLDQPAWLMELFGVIDSVKATHERKVREMEKEKRG